MARRSRRSSRRGRGSNDMAVTALVLAGLGVAGYYLYKKFMAPQLPASSSPAALPASTASTASSLPASVWV